MEGRRTQGLRLGMGHACGRTPGNRLSETISPQVELPQCGCDAERSRQRLARRLAQFAVLPVCGGAFLVTRSTDHGRAIRACNKGVQ